MANGAVARNCVSFSSRIKEHFISVLLSWAWERKCISLVYCQPVAPAKAEAGSSCSPNCFMIYAPGKNLMGLNISQIQGHFGSLQNTRQ